MVVNIETLKDGQWADVEAKVVQLWDNDHAAIRQVGIVGDETGIVKFVSWEKSNLPLMEEGATYEIMNVAVSSYEDRLQIALNSTTGITRVLTGDTGDTGSEQSQIPTV